MQSNSDGLLIRYSVEGFFARRNVQNAMTNVHVEGLLHAITLFVEMLEDER